MKLLAILLLTSIVSGFAETKTITGKVTDTDGVPLYGVRISVKGTSNYTISDKGGKFSISVTEYDRLLVFSLAGYSSEEILTGGRDIINLVMKNERLLKTDSTEKIISSEKEFPMIASSPSMKSRDVVTASYRNFTYEFNTEGYSSVNESGFRNVTINPLSTFSIDVDNASYSNIRRFINNGQLPPPDAVRIEEMINYFRYDYPEPGEEHPFSVYSELTGCPWNVKHKLLMIGLKGKSIDKSSLPPSNLVFLIDVSGSMNSPNKLPLLKSAFGLLVNELRPEDLVAIVVYAGAAGLVLESTPGNRKETIMKALNNLEAGGSTAGGEGLRLAYKEAERNFIAGGNNRIILATDGDFNVGESSNGGMERLVSEKRELGVYITVLGFGMGNIKDDKMEIIADKGNGNYSYIDNLQEARRVLVREFGGTLFTIAEDVKFQIEFNPSVIESYRMIGYDNRILNEEDFNDDTKDAGEMGAGHNVTVLYELVPSGYDADMPMVDPLRYQVQNEKKEKIYSDEALNIKIRYKIPGKNTSNLFEQHIGDDQSKIESSSENIRFAAAVAEFGMILRDSEFRGTSTFESALNLAKISRGWDDDGYRAELIRLISSVRELNLSHYSTGNQHDDI